MSCQVERLGVDIVIRTFHTRESHGALVEDLSKEGHGAKHVCLVDTGHTSFPAPRLALLGETKREVVQLLGSGAGYSQGFACLVVTDDLAASVGRCGIKESLGGFAQNHEVDVRGPLVGETPWRIRVGFDGPYAGVELQCLPETQVRCDLRTILVTHAGKSDGAQENCIGDRRRFLRSRRHVASGFSKADGTGVQEFVTKGQAPIRR